VTQGDDAHLTAADGTQERDHLVDAGQELGPQDATGHAAGSCTRRSCQGAGRCRLRGVARRSHGVGGRVGRRWGLHIGWRPVGLGPADGDHGGSQACVGSQDPVVAVPVAARLRVRLPPPPSCDRHMILRRRSPAARTAASRAPRGTRDQEQTPTDACPLGVVRQGGATWSGRVAHR